MSHIKSTITIGFIGQGYVGKNYADDFEMRGYVVKRYAKDGEHSSVDCQDAIKECDVVFVAVPTPTTPSGFDAGTLRQVIPLTRPSSVVVIKSTLVPGLTQTLQDEFPDRVILHSPEFLSEATATHDTQHPFMNIIGIPRTTREHEQAAELILSILPPSAYQSVVSSDEAEIIKYSHNCSGYVGIIFFNLMYDITQKLGADWSVVEAALRADPYIPHTYISPMHKSGRGAGGHCFIKDMAALSQVYQRVVGDGAGVNVLKSVEEKNKMLLRDSGKNVDLLNGVYGEEHVSMPLTQSVASVLNTTMR